MAEEDTAASNNTWDPKKAKKAELKNCLVTGGSGFLGSNLVKELIERGCNVRTFDIVPPDYSHERLEHHDYDLRNEDDMIRACEGMDTVFHTAAAIILMGGSAVKKQYRRQAYEINVEGTRNIISACRKTGVKRLVYTSSNNVCFNGKPNPDMDSNTPYATRFIDLYTETKVTIEPEVLKASDDDGLLTCAIRPSGIYGPGKCIIFDRFITELAKGRIVVNIGNPNSVQDNSYIENLVHAEILAAEHLIPGSPACGKAYFITDDEPKNNCEFFRPLIEALGYKPPKIWIPMWIVMPYSLIVQWLHSSFGFPPPFIYPIELEKVCITHFSNIKDAERDLGYKPLKTVEQAFEACIAYFEEKIAEIKKSG